MRYLDLPHARAKAKSPDDVWDDPMWIAEHKRDGWREHMHFGGGLDRVFVTGRRTSVETGQLSEKGLCVPWLWPSERFRGMIGYTVIDGEVESPTESWRDVAGFMNVSPEDSLKRSLEIGRATLTVWDVLFWDGVDLRDRCLGDRFAILRDAVTFGGLCPSEYGHDLVRLIERGPATRTWFQDVVARGGEGVVLKDLASSYGESGSWIKVRKRPTVDLVVTGFHPGRGKYSGQIGSLLCSVFTSGGTLIQVARAGGMDDATRREMTDDPRRWIGVVVECEAKEFSKQNLISPQFKRRRDDKDARSCTFQKMLFDLAQGDRKAEPEQLILL